MTNSHDKYTVCREILEALLNSSEPLSRRTVNKIKNRVCAKYHCDATPSNADILETAIPEESDTLRPFLQKRPVRTLSGVAVVATMTRPQACPHGKCAYCPGGPDLGVPQSYTGYEPAAMRGIQNEFDPYRQVESRLHQLKTIGHSINKVELIVMGGDWCSKPVEYQQFFVKGCLDAMNRTIGGSLAESMKANETAEVRNIGLTFETRPDWVTRESIDSMLEMGATRIELGVQTLSDDILAHVERGHGVDATVRATKLLKDGGLKVCYHMMPGLPGSTPEDDIATFNQLFSDSRFRPDMLKIYPTVVVKNTKLYDWWKAGEYVPYSNKEIVALVSTAVSRMPEYVRIQRMQRDIPLHQIEAGLNQGNLRELVQLQMKAEGLRDPTIRYREIGHFQMRSGTSIDTDNIRLVRRDYDASDGTEIFISFEEQNLDVLIGFVRLRVPSKDVYRPEAKENQSAIIRELRVYGPVVEIGKRDEGAWQHLGLGEKMLDCAQEVACTEFDSKQILVNSGIGVKEYYRGLGFVDKGPYLSKDL
jgi:elongator complex protein 3